jgi:hypothetical protein
MKEFESRLVQYVVGDVEKLVEKQDSAKGPSQHWLALVAHDEMTAQAHDGKSKSWLPKGEQPLHKKGNLLDKRLAERSKPDPGVREEL